MGIQEIAVLAIVIIAAFFTGKKFVRQFTHGDGAEKCDECELNKVISENKP